MDRKWPDDSEFFGAPEHSEPEIRLSDSHERLCLDLQPHQFVKQPPTWQGTTGKPRTMDDFIKENFPNGVYIPSYMLFNRD